MKNLLDFGIKPADNNQAAALLWETACNPPQDSRPDPVGRFLFSGQEIGQVVSRMSNAQPGWIALHRKLLENPISKKPTVVWYFIYCLLKANHQPQRIIWDNQQILIERGELLTGRKSAEKDTGLSQQNIRSAQKALYHLRMLEKSTTKSTTKFTVIKVCNYSTYQDLSNLANHQTNQQLTTSQPPANHQLTTNNNNNNINNDNNNIKNNPPIIPQGDVGNDKPKEKKKKEWKFPEGKREALKEFLNKYPRKIGIAQLEKTFNKRYPADISLEKMLLLLEEDLPEFSRREPEHVPHPSSWINKRYMDEPASQAKLTRKNTERIYKPHPRLEGVLYTPDNWLLWNKDKTRYEQGGVQVKMSDTDRKEVIKGGKVA